VIETELLVTVASWEERFILGLSRLLTDSRPQRMMMYHFKEYDKFSGENRTFAEELCKKHKIILTQREISFDNPAITWHTIYDSLNTYDLKGKEVLVDFTTMPRETLWSALDLLEEKDSAINYVYFRPERYNSSWLSRDPGKPRLVLKLAGEPKLGMKTLLLILTGYDPERVDQLVRFFDPYYTLMGIQAGEQFSNRAMNLSKYKQYQRQRAFTMFSLDAYGDDHGFTTIDQQLKDYLGNFNIIMASLGPKPSAIALYRLKKKYPEISLAYAPSKEYNREYSYGIGEKCSGRI